MFIIFIIFMIIQQSDIYNFADDNTLCSCREWLTEIKENLIFDTKVILYWFRLNSLKANPGKFQFRILGDKSYHKGKLKLKLQALTKYLRLTRVFMRDSTQRKRCNFCFLIFIFFNWFNFHFGWNTEL